MENNNDFYDLVDKIAPDLVAWRRELHCYPESGWTEYKTTAFIAEKLQSWGWRVYMGNEAIDKEARMGVPPLFELTRCEERATKEGVSREFLEKMKGGMTGLVAEWTDGLPGPVTAFRFDIDANDVKETDEKGHVPVKEGFRSLHDGCMHACGHDGHTVIGLGIALLIAQSPVKIKGTVRLLFQPAEEGARGALSMVKKGWLDDVDYFLSGHIGFRCFTLGEVVLNTTGFYATTKLDVEFKGQAAHAGGEPELGKNALLAASTAAINLHSISRHSKGASRINVGKLIAGTGRNIVPSYAFMQLETRGETEEINQFMTQQAERILQASASMYDVEVEINRVGLAGQAEGNPEWAEELQTLLQTSRRVQYIEKSRMLGASEDVVHMMKRVQERGGWATYMMFGSPLSAMHHQPEFNFDEEVIKIALECYVKVVENKNIM